MKKSIIKIAFVFIFAGIILFTGCGNTTQTANQNQQPVTAATTAAADKISLEYAPVIMDLASILPASYKPIDPKEEGISNADMGLGDKFTEVYAYLSEEPFQLIYGFYYIENSSIARASTDAMFKDEAQIKKLIVDNITAGLNKSNVNSSSVETTITYPEIADLSVYGKGQMSVEGVAVGFDIFLFRVGKVYLYLYSVYHGDNALTLDNLAIELTNRVSAYKQ